MNISGTKTGQGWVISLTVHNGFYQVFLLRTLVQRLRVPLQLLLQSPTLGGPPQLPLLHMNSLEDTRNLARGVFVLSPFTVIPSATLLSV